MTDELGTSRLSPREEGDAKGEVALFLLQGCGFEREPLTPNRATTGCSRRGSPGFDRTEAISPQGYARPASADRRLNAKLRFKTCQGTLTMTPLSIWNRLSLQRVTILVGLGATALALATIAPPARSASAATSNACFWSRDVLSTRAPNNTTVYLRVSGKGTWELKLFSPCPDVSWSNRVALRTRGSDRVCEGRGLNVEVIPNRTPTSPGSRSRCKVTSVRQLTSAESQALPASSRP